jgi:hypothetical protein
MVNILALLVNLVKLVRTADGTTIQALRGV